MLSTQEASPEEIPKSTLDATAIRVLTTLTDITVKECHWTEGIHAH